MANFYKMVDTYRVVHANSPLHLHSENAPTKKDVLGPKVYTALLKAVSVSSVVFIVINLSTRYTTTTAVSYTHLTLPTKRIV